MIKYQPNDITSANKNTIITGEKETLHHPFSVIVLETDGLPEAYPQLAVNHKNKLAALYYWATKENPQQHIATTIWKP